MKFFVNQSVSLKGSLRINGMHLSIHRKRRAVALKANKTAQASTKILIIKRCQSGEFVLMIPRDYRVCTSGRGDTFIPIRHAGFWRFSPSRITFIHH